MIEDPQAFIQTFVTELESNQSLDSFRRPPEIQNLLNEWRTTFPGKYPPEQMSWELAALDVRPIHRRYRQKPTEAGLGPMDLTILLGDDRVLEYYRQRAQVTENPIRKVRYADLVLHALLQRQSRDVFAFATLAFEGYVGLVPVCIQEGEYLEACSYLDRAGQVAMQFNNRRLADQVVVTVDTCLAVVPELALHRWILELSDTLLALDEKWNEIVPLDLWLRIRQAVIAGVAYYDQGKPRNLHLLQALLDLAHAVSVKLREDDRAWSYRVKIVAVWECEAAEREAQPAPLGGSLAAFKLMEDVLHYSQWLVSQAPSDEAKDEARQKVEQAKAQVRRLMKQAEGEMTHVSHSADIPREALEQLVEPLLKASPDEVPAMLSQAPFLLPCMSDIRQAASKTAEQYIFASLFGQITLRDGRKVNEIPPMEGEAVHVALHMQVWYQTHYQLLHFIFHRLQEEGLLSAAIFSAHVRSWDLVDEEDIPFIEVGLERYFAGDFVSALHVLTPRIEHMLRSAFEQAGVIPLVVPNQRQIREQTLGDFLDRNEVREVLGEDIWHYFHYVLLDESGPNLRNDVAHGWISSPECNSVTVQVILFSMLVLTRFRKRTVVEDANQTPVVQPGPEPCR